MPLHSPARQILSPDSLTEEIPNKHNDLIPGLREDMAKICVALVPRRDFPAMDAVSRSWRYFIVSREFRAIRKEVGKFEEFVYVLARKPGYLEGSCWEVLGEYKNREIPPMGGLTKVGFGVVVLRWKLFVMGGYDTDHGKDHVSDEVYQYDAELNRCAALAKMNFARRVFACTEVNGIIYVAGGFDSSGDDLSSVEAYDPRKNKWTLIDNLRRPRSGCFAFGMNNKLYIMGGRSSFTLGNPRSIDVYDPSQPGWVEIKTGCMAVTSYAVFGKSLFCIDSQDSHSLSVFTPWDNSWDKIVVPFTGYSRTRFCLGVHSGKLLLFPQEENYGYQTMTYDPAAAPGSQWGTSELKPPRSCVRSVTIEA